MITSLVKATSSALQRFIGVVQIIVRTKTALCVLHVWSYGPVVPSCNATDAALPSQFNTSCFSFHPTYPSPLPGSLDLSLKIYVYIYIYILFYLPLVSVGTMAYRCCVTLPACFVTSIVPFLCCSFPFVSVASHSRWTGHHKFTNL